MKKPSWTKVATLAIWLSTLAAVQFWIWQRDCTPGAPALPRNIWPADAEVSRATDGFTLLMCADASCPCSAASIRELNRLLASLPPELKPRTYLILAQPGADNTLQATVQTLKDIYIYIDKLGVEASRFHAKTSGQMFVYDREGRLRFSGGLTIARGHEGRSQSYDDLNLLLRAKDVHTADTVLKFPVFGCPIEISESSVASVDPS